MSYLLVLIIPTDKMLNSSAEVIFMGLKLYIQIVTIAHPSEFIFQIHCRLYCYSLINNLISVSSVHRSSRQCLDNVLENMQVKRNTTMIKMEYALKFEAKVCFA